MKRRKPAKVVVLTWHPVESGMELKVNEDDNHCLCRISRTDWDWVDGEAKGHDWFIQCFHPDRESHKGMQLGAYSSNDSARRLELAESLVAEVCKTTYYGKEIRFDRSNIKTRRRR